MVSDTTVVPPCEIDQEGIMYISVVSTPSSFSPKANFHSYVHTYPTMYIYP